MIDPSKHRKTNSASSTSSLKYATISFEGDTNHLRTASIERRLQGTSTSGWKAKEGAAGAPIHGRVVQTDIPGSTAARLETPPCISQKRRRIHHNLRGQRSSKGRLKPKKRHMWMQKGPTPTSLEMLRAKTAPGYNKSKLVNEAEARHRTPSVASMRAEQTSTYISRVAVDDILWVSKIRMRRL